ncbi:beta strand repeat-containing protein [Microbacterium elymi]|uniref:Uncharacterized protein n=1 Tax=Microbacterium elymi TaxID=2909587 RepID=A0ABY5NL40_9MICO|nr:hypothetical protein [Microbacterium elymi]UUT35880.1 hypothetical protein L2X98_22240 [Microbacterium elymi]
MAGVDETTSAVPFLNAFDPASAILPGPDGRLTVIQLAYAVTDGNLQTGDAVVYRTGGGDPIGVVTNNPRLLPPTLVNNRTYYAIVVKPGYIELAATFAQAMALDPLVLIPSKATGDAHYLVADGGDGPKMGIGASFALSIDNVTTTAGIQNGAVLTGGAALEIRAEDDNTVDTLAISGSGGDIALSPAVALAIVNLTTSAVIGTGTALGLSGDVVVAASQTAETTTESSGDVDPDKVGIALALALAVVADDVHATLSRDLHAHGPVTISATGSSTNEGGTDAAAPGSSGQTAGGINATANRVLGQGNAVSTLNTGKGAAKTSTPTAGTSDNGGASLSIAGAFTILIVTTWSRATIGDHLSIASDTGTVTVASSANTDAVGEANGSTATKGSVGVGAGVAVNDVSMTNVATTGASAIDAHGLTVTATMTPVDSEDGESDTVHTVSATATSGASNAAKVGVAGALAINIVSADTEALIPSGASADAHEGDVTLTAVFVQHDTAEASSKAGFKTCAQVLGLPCNISTAITGQDATGAGLGVGASVAIQVLTPTVTIAQIADGVPVAAGGDLAITADSERSVTTIAEAGTKGGSAFSPAVALVVDTGDTATAGLGSAPGVLTVDGAVTIRATHTLDAAETEANANVEAEKVAVGAAVALPIIIGWSTLARLGRGVTAAEVTVTAESEIEVAATANASAIGGFDLPSGGKTTDQTATDTVAKDPNAGGKGANSPPSADSAAKQGGTKAARRAANPAAVSGSRHPSPSSGSRRPTPP